ncbi:MAG: three component ABC system middle component [Pseudomonadota bacterium]|nr:three component ABC system middle component [Pseudomonadota bacterium]
MSNLAEEVRIWNTPIVGSYVLWRFTRGYTDHHPEGRPPILLLHFLASAILTNKRLSDPVTNIRKDLASYARRFIDKKDIDLLLSIQDRVNKTRSYTLSSIDLAIQHGLLFLNSEDACLYPKILSGKPSRGMTPKQSVKSLGNKAETLGKWFSAHSVSQVATLLKVVL